MKQVFIFFIAILIFSTLVIAQTDSFTYYNLKVHYNNGSLNINSIEIEILDSEIEETGFWIAEIRDYKENSLNTFFFDVDEEILWDGVNPKTGKIEYGGKGNLSEFDLEVMIPYEDSGDKIIIYNDKFEKITNVDISMFSKDYEEKLEAIKQENESVQEKEIKRESERTRGFFDSLADYWWVLLIILIVLVIIFIVSLLKEELPKKNVGSGTYR